MSISNDDEEMNSKKDIESQSDVSSKDKYEMTDYYNDKNDKEKYDFLAQGCTTFFDKGVRSVLITGIELSNGKLSNLIVSRDGYSFCQTERYGGSYSGTGDRTYCKWVEY